MKTRALAMPAFVAKLITEEVLRLGLEPNIQGGDVVFAPLTHEDGSELSLVIMCIGERRWFHTKASIKSQLGIRLKTLRKARTLTLVELAALSGSLPRPYPESGTELCPLRSV
ncbi:hypothetical protein [Hoeflea sp.]|uniref:hypothetical protein n=1 Tax=Hoeflea sp. TaxID=1940281 RepID=UPI0025B92FDB|nr:hypothetical protein [Hoeflea sp.]